MENMPGHSNHSNDGEMNKYVDLPRMSSMWPYSHHIEKYPHHIDKYPHYRTYYHEPQPQQPQQQAINEGVPISNSVSNGVQQQQQQMHLQQQLQQQQQQQQQQLQQQLQQQQQHQMQLQQQQIQQQIQQQQQQQQQLQLQQQQQQQMHIQHQQQIQQQAQQHVQIQQQPQQQQQLQHPTSQQVTTVVNSVPVMGGTLQSVLTPQTVSQNITVVSQNHTGHHSSIHTSQASSGSSSSASAAHDHNTTQILTRMRLQDLVREVDPNEQLDEDVEDVLLQLADDFVDSAITAACLLAKHRKSNTVEVKDLQLHLERNWNMWIPGFGTDELRPYKRATVTEAHKQRLSLIRKTLKKY